MNKGNRSNAFQSSSDQSSFSKEKMFDKEDGGAAFNTKEDIGGDASKSSFSNASSEARSSAVEKTIKKNILEENKPKLSSRFDSARDIMRSAGEASKDNEDENKLRNAFKPPFLVPYDDRFSGVRIGTVVNIYTTADGNIFEFRGTRRIDPIIGAEILYNEQENENLECITIYIKSPKNIKESDIIPDEEIHFFIKKTERRNIL